MPEVTIDTVNGEFDFETILDLIRLEWPHEWEDKGDGELVRWMADSWDQEADTMKLLRNERGTTIAFLRYTRWPREAVRTRTVHLLDISVAKDVQRNGFGSLLMEDLLAECGRRGFRWILSRTLTSNAPSIALHRRFGFELDFETDDSIVWRKTVESEGERP